MTGLYCERAKWAYHVAPSEWAAGGRTGDQDGSAHKGVIDCGALGSIDWHWLP